MEKGTKVTMLITIEGRFKEGDVYTIDTCTSEIKDGIPFYNLIFKEKGMSGIWSMPAKHMMYLRNKNLEILLNERIEI